MSGKRYQIIMASSAHRRYKKFEPSLQQKIQEEADKFAYRQGLFVLTGSGEGLITMLNLPDFKPKDFGNPYNKA